MRLSYLLLSLVFLILTGCSSSKLLGQKGKISQEPEYNRTKSNQDFGLALSGGGLRSASFAYGALKQMHDSNLLQSFDVVSSVSGGGYTAYELFLNQKNSPSYKFGSSMFNDDSFDIGLYSHYIDSRFVTYGALIKTVVTSDTPAKLYKRRIRQKYGSLDHPNGGFVFPDFIPRDKGNMPEWIVNTTILDPKPLTRNGDIYEFTPFGAGSSDRGYLPYSENGTISLLDGIAISGAAEKTTLKRKVIDPTGKSNQILTLSDGGHSENLGAYSLIDRGVKNIVILDAEHDPKYGFGAYHKLKKRLDFKGVKTGIETDIDKMFPYSSDSELVKKEKESAHFRFATGRSTTSIFKGKAYNSQGQCSNIYYLKMANTKAVKHELQNNELIARGSKKIDEIKKVLNLGDGEVGNSDPSLLASVDTDTQAVLAHYLDEYPVTLRNLRKIKLINAIGNNFIKLEFPQYSTGDQSFYLDQFMAFVGLGFFSSKSLSNVISEKKPCDKGV